MTKSYPKIPRMSDWAVDVVTEIEEGNVIKEGLGVFIWSYCQIGYVDMVEGLLFLWINYLRMNSVNSFLWEEEAVLY